MQENVIIKARKKERRHGNDNDKQGQRVKCVSKIEVDYSDIISPKNSESFIRIPTSELDVKILHIIDKWPSTLNKHGRANFDRTGG